MSDFADKIMNNGVYVGRYVSPDGQVNLFFKDSRGDVHQVIVHEGKQSNLVRSICKWFRENPNQVVPDELKQFLNPFTGEYPQYLLSAAMYRTIFNMQEDLGITDDNDRMDFEEDFMLHPDNAEYWCVVKPTKTCGRIIV